MQELDQFQKSAVIETSNTLLIAGAGAGKTFTIVKKVEHLITKLHYKPEEILIISFTNKSVLDLKKKILYNTDISTFHKLAINILSSYNINYTIVNESYLNYIINEFFLTLELESQLEILKYFHKYDYTSFLKSYSYQELVKTISTIIKIYKTNNCSINNFKKLFKKDNLLAKYTYIIYNIYENELKSSNSMDFDDLIINATNALKKPYKYKYIIIDEFQDTSIIRFNLVNKLRIINNATLFCVGDDYQSIYHFSGCDLNIFLEFTKIVPNSKVLKLKYTYRNSQELINIAANFIQKNNTQLKKELISNKHINKPIEIIYYLNPKKSFERLYKKVSNVNSDTLVLGRNNHDIKKYTNKKVNYLTVHSSKGLEAENVIIINLTNHKYGFPNKIVNNNLVELLHPSDKSYLYAEERRLFYVALTRSKNKVYLLVPIFHKSKFIKEIR